MQEDVKITNRPYTQVNFLVAWTKSKWDRLWEMKHQDIVMEAISSSDKIVAKWEITKMGNFNPIHDKNNVHYIIIPNTFENKKDDEWKFFLRIFASEHIDLIELPKTIE